MADAATVAARILAGEAPRLIALDVDGTLAPIVNDPDAARVPAATLALLDRLRRQEGIVLALITGRDAAALATLVPDSSFWRAVEHGGRLLSPGEDGTAPAPKDEALEAFGAWVLASGARYEAKARSVGVHVRGLNVPDDLLDRAEEEARRHGLQTRRGRGVLEASRELGDKGSALRAIAREVGAKSVFFAGDDVTDLPAIAWAVECGVGALVESDEGPSAPRGAVRVAGTDALVDVLQALVGGA